MKKLKLSLKELKVDSFDTTTKSLNTKGTVNGNISTRPCITVYICPYTEQESCPNTHCGGTCTNDIYQCC